MSTYEAWETYLLDQGIPRHHVVVLPGGVHSGTEARNMLTYAGERGWDEIGIASYEHHIARCYATFVGVIDEFAIRPRIFPFAGPSIPWLYPLLKPVMDAGEDDVMGTIAEHVRNEIHNYVRYGQKPQLVGGKPEFTYNARPHEVKAYMRSTM